MMSWYIRLGFTTFVVAMTRVVSGRSILGLGSRLQVVDEVGLAGSSWVKSTTVTCTPTYGFLPCTTELWGELFMIVVYNYLTAVGSSYVSKGSDLFFHMFGTGILGASLFQMVGTVPQMVVMLVSILASDSDTLESMAAMIMAMLAGSAIFSLTIIWGSVIAFGSQQLSASDSNPSSTTSTSTSSSSFNFDQIIKNSFSSSYGVRTDEETKLVARVLIFESMIPFLILQLAEILSSSTAKRIVILLTLIITVILLLIYIAYEIFKPWIQEKSYEYIVRKNMQPSLLQQYLTSSGKPNEALIKDLFHKIDKNSNSKISEAELYAFILGIQIEEVGLIGTDEFSQKVMNEFDNSHDTQISETEFIQGISKWLTEAFDDDFSSTNTNRTRSAVSQRSSEEEETLIAAQNNKKAVSTTTNKPSGKAWWNYTKAVFMIVLGTGIMMLIGMPLMINVQGFATAAGIPSFLISYVIIPLSMGYRQLITAISTSRKKTVKDISLSLTQIYNGVFMNNMLSLAIFLVIVYVKDISWDVSAEVLVVLLICTLMGFISSFLTKFPFWIGVFAYTLYPISILILYLLTEVFGW